MSHIREVYKVIWGIEETIANPELLDVYGFKAPSMDNPRYDSRTENLVPRAYDFYWFDIAEGNWYIVCGNIMHPVQWQRSEYIE